MGDGGGKREGLIVGSRVGLEVKGQCDKRRAKFDRGERMIKPNLDLKYFPNYSSPPLPLHHKPLTPTTPSPSQTTHPHHSLSIPYHSPPPLPLHHKPLTPTTPSPSQTTKPHHSLT
ncbi:hypothetical protein Pcinc_043996 [Petrolisthes cinctipes]|uniref:Uncharacterized protein n=1 Tax=Petrolisthes cinctipes TaxID=88211 RepID=A0AAE1EET1_PETCI|nr:hypothetical protein Pcinc_043996 [Petrolisthes cinctipes]